MVKNKVKQHEVFFSFLKIGVFGFGGGAATIPLFHKEAVEKKQWMSEDEFSDMLATMQTLPGPMQTKMAGYIGYRTTGILGIFSGLAGIILPSLILMIAFLNLIASNKDKPWVTGLAYGILPVVGIMMAVLTWQFIRKSQKTLGIKFSSLLIILSALFILIIDLHPIIILIPLLFLALLLPENIKQSMKKTIVVTSIIIGLSLLLIFIIQSQTWFGWSINLPTLNLDALSGSTFLNIFIAFLIPGVIGYGGGPAMQGLFRYEIINRFNWSDAQFGEMLGIGQALPGVTATKVAGYTGFFEGNEALGFGGGLLGTTIGILAMVAPSLILMIVLMNLLKKYRDYPQVKRLSNFVRPTIVILLTEIVFNFFKDSILNNGWIHTIILGVYGYLLLQRLKVHPIFVIIGALTYGAILLG